MRLLLGHPRWRGLGPHARRGHHQPVARRDPGAGPGRPDPADVHRRASGRDPRRRGLGQQRVADHGVPGRPARRGLRRRRGRDRPPGRLLDLQPRRRHRGPGRRHPLDDRRRLRGGERHQHGLAARRGRGRPDLVRATGPERRRARSGPPRERRRPRRPRPRQRLRLRPGGCRGGPVRGGPEPAARSRAGARLHRSADHHVQPAGRPEDADLEDRRRRVHDQPRHDRRHRRAAVLAARERPLPGSRARLLRRRRASRLHQPHPRDQACGPVSATAGMPLRSTRRPSWPRRSAPGSRSSTGRRQRSSRGHPGRARRASRRTPRSRSSSPSRSGACRARRSG